MLQLDDCRIVILDTGRLIISPSNEFMETYYHRVAHEFENPDELLKALQPTSESSKLEIDDEWFTDQIKIVDDFMQNDNIPNEVKQAYFHGVRGWMSRQFNELALMKSQPEAPREETISKWHYYCENTDCDRKCEMFIVGTISNDRGCPEAKWGKKANWGNLGIKEREILGEIEC